MSNTFFVFLPSNIPEFPDNRPNKFKVRLAKPIHFNNGTWLCGLHSISFPFSWPATIGTLDDQWIGIHIEDKSLNGPKEIRIPIPKGSQTEAGGIQKLIESAIKLQIDTLDSTLNREKMQTTTREKRELSPPRDNLIDALPPEDKNENKKRAREAEKNDEIEKTAPQAKIAKQQQASFSAPVPVALAQENGNNPYAEVLNTIMLADKTPEKSQEPEELDVLDMIMGVEREPLDISPPLWDMQNFMRWKNFVNLKFVKYLLSSLQIQYLKEFERFKAVFTDERIHHISFSSQLGYVLGFENVQYVENEETAKYGCDLHGGFASFAVYLNGITENMIVGNTLSSLLRVVYVEDTKPGQYTEKVYNSPILARVQCKEVQEIDVELRTMDGGRLVPFNYGTVLIVLIFKKVINF